MDGKNKIYKEGHNVGRKKEHEEGHKQGWNKGRKVGRKEKRKKKNPKKRNCFGEALEGKIQINQILLIESSAKVQEIKSEVCQEGDLRSMYVPLKFSISCTYSEI